VKTFGLVGFPNAGKSSLFNALTNSEVLAAPYPFATVDTHVGIASVPDARLSQLAELSGSSTRTAAQIQFSDIGGLVEGAHKGEGLGNQFLSHIREVDAIVYVLRAFASADLPLEVDPATQLELLEVELSLADYESAQRQLEKRQRQLKGDVSLREEVGLLAQASEILSSGTPIYRSSLSERDRQALANNFLLTNKPSLVLVNIDEDKLENESATDKTAIQKLLDIPASEIITMCVSLEAEIALLPTEEQAAMLSELGLGEGGLANFAQAAYRLLSLRTFFTTGEKETRAWTFPAGASARECAGAIHTDFARGFIRAETIAFEELLACGSWVAAKQQGTVRSEGRDYRPEDGDAMEFRFNV